MTVIAHHCVSLVYHLYMHVAYRQKVSWTRKYIVCQMMGCSDITNNTLGNMDLLLCISHLSADPPHTMSRCYLKVVSTLYGRSNKKNDFKKLVVLEIRLFYEELSF